MSSSAQNKFPYLWLIFQLAIGATYDKRKLAVKHYKGEKNILEVGCSLGNITPAFLPFKNFKYLGIDIDAGAINIAQKTFAKNPNISFRNVSLEKLAEENQTFDYILFAGMLHHTDDELSVSLLKDAKKLLAENGKIVVYEPESFRASDNLLFKLYAKLEQGEHLRSKEKMLNLLHLAGIYPTINEDILLAPSIFSFPKVIRFNLLVA